MNRKEIESIEREIRNFIIYFASDEKEREQMYKAVDTYVKEDLKERYLK